MTPIQVIAALLLLTLTYPAEAVECQGSVVSAQGVVGFSGCISAEVADTFVDAMKEAPSLVVVQSSGGDVSAAIRMARAIGKSGSAVVVRGLCFSSCANYLMPAGQ